MRTDGPVVIALDGTMHSAATLAWGMAEAVRRRADVILTQAIVDPWLTTAWAWYPVLDGAESGVDAKEYLADQQLREEARHPDMTIETRVLRGSVVPELSELSTDAQLLVVGAGMPSGRARSGVVGAHLAAHARSPVAVVRSAADEETLPEAPIVVGVDGSSASVAAANVAAREAWMRGRSLLVVHARPTVRAASTAGDGADVEDSTYSAAHVVAQSLRTAHPGLQVRLEFVDDDPAEALVTLAKGAALLVVGSRGLGGFRGMLLGSVSNDVVRSAPCPVLVVHDSEGE